MGGSSTGLKFQSKKIKTSRSIAVLPLLSLLLDLSIESSFVYLLMGGELGDETYVDVPLVSLALSPSVFTLVENTDLRHS